MWDRNVHTMVFSVLDKLCCLCKEGLFHISQGDFSFSFVLQNGNGMELKISSQQSGLFKPGVWTLHGLIGT